MSIPYRIVHRRNATASGVMLMVAGLAFALSAALPLAHLTGPHIGIGEDGIGFDLAPGGDLNPDPQQLWLWTGGFVFVFGIALLATRVRGLGILWRFLAFVPLAIMGALAGYVWYIVQDPVDALAGGDADSTSTTIAHALYDAASGLGLLHVSAGGGLLVLSGAVACGIIALFIPAGRSQFSVPIPYRAGRQQFPQQQASAPYPPAPGYPPQDPRDEPPTSTWPLA